MIRLKVHHPIIFESLNKEKFYFVDENLNKKELTKDEIIELYNKTMSMPNHTIIHTEKECIIFDYKISKEKIKELIK